jgi:hypothetical protein
MALRFLEVSQPEAERDQESAPYFASSSLAR